MAAAALVALGAWVACSPSDFTSETVIDTVRILASRATEPRAKPGDSVTVQLLAYDGRVNPPSKMNLYWLPLLCTNPANDAYYACFAQLGGVGDGGIVPVLEDGGGLVAPVADAGLKGLLTPGVDLTPALVEGSSFTFPVPKVVIPRKGASPYGLVIVFNFACAGHLEFLAYDPGSQNPQQIPLGCFDENHNQLGPDDFVFGFTRVYVEDNPVEVNPEITGLSLAGQTVAIDDAGVSTVPLTADLCEGDADTCGHEAIGPVVPPSKPSNKQVWADFFATTGTFTSEARLLYDPMATLDIPNGTNDKYVQPNTTDPAPPKQNFIWIVVHDDQGGAAWVTVPVHFGGADAGADAH
jgi:hypothetical protein